jgi:Holliday junction resolvasome RuvABC endonuclease subunit
VPAPPKILAADIATQTGIAEGRPGETPSLSTLKFGGDGVSHARICANCLDWIACKLTDDPPDIIVIEAPLPIGAAIGRGRSNAKSIIRLQGLYCIVLAAATLKRIRVCDYEVGPIRTAFIGEPKLKGDEAKRRCKRMCEMLGWPAKNLDEADAAALWYFACASEAPKLAPIIHSGMHKRLINQSIAELFRA